MNWTVIGIVVSIYLFTKSQASTVATSANPAAATNPLTALLNNAINGLSAAASKGSSGGGGGAPSGLSVGSAGSTGSPSGGAFDLASYLANANVGSNAPSLTGTVQTTGLVSSENQPNDYVTPTVDTTQQSNFTWTPPAYSPTGNQDTSTPTDFAPSDTSSYSDPSVVDYANMGGGSGSGSDYSDSLE